MRVSTQPADGNKVKLSVEIDEAEFDQAIESALQRLAREARLPGFRPGKVPRRLLAARMGQAAVREETLRESLPNFYLQALQDAELDAITTAPEIDITAGEDAGAVSFDALVEVRPSVSIAGYQGLAVTLPRLDPTDEEVSAQLDRLRDQYGELVPVGRPARDGDHLTIDMKGYVHSETVPGLTADDFVYELGSGAVVPELDQELQGKRPGDILRFSATAPNGEIGFQVLVKEVKEKILPEPTDEWASDASEFDTVAELRDDLRNRLRTLRQAQARILLTERAVDALAELVDLEPPEAMIGAEMEQRLHELVEHRLAPQGVSLEQYLERTGQSNDELMAQLRAVAVRAVRADLALRALVAAESIEVGDEEVDARVAQLAERAGQRPDRLRADIERAGRLGELRSELGQSKAIAWLVENVTLVDEEGRPIDRADLLAAEREENQGGGPSPAGLEPTIDEPTSDEPTSDEPTTDEPSNAAGSAT
ncbi:MAG: trigger factor [Acidimicrobiales bacterium]|nr:trigger factor [Acidimicrobiales bacterium]MBO0893997.1 trigger factor [Acidimicrobiales bacterium]